MAKGGCLEQSETRNTQLTLQTLATERGLGFQTAGSGTRTREFRVSSPALCLGANLRRDVTSRLLFLNQSVLADFDNRKKNYRIQDS